MVTANLLCFLVCGWPLGCLHTVCLLCSELLATLQFLAPYTGATIAEYFMLQGEATCTVYDDLTKHAIWIHEVVNTWAGICEAAIRDRRIRGVKIGSGVPMAWYSGRAATGFMSFQPRS